MTKELGVSEEVRTVQKIRLQCNQIQSDKPKTRGQDAADCIVVCNLRGALSNGLFCK